MCKLNKINDNLYKLEENNIKLIFNKIYMPFDISKLYNKYNLSIEINNDNDKYNNIIELNKYKDLENTISSLKLIDKDIKLEDYIFYSNLKNKVYKNNNLDLLRLSIKKSKNSFITKYFDNNNNEKTIFDIVSKNHYNCEIECNYIWIKNNKFGLVLNLILLQDVK